MTEYNQVFSMKGKELWLSLVGIVLLSAVFLLFFSPATSPLHLPVYKGIDNFIFQTIGKGWAEGHLPYVEAWDHKGPLIFLVNAIGYSLTGDNTGLYYVQILFLSTTLFIVYRWIREFFSKVWSAAIVLVFLFYYNTYAIQGNTVEEFCLPFLLIGYYGLYLWAREAIGGGKTAHNHVFAVVYGITISICFQTRLTNALGLCGGIVVIGIILLMKREWRNVLSNTLAIIVGFVLPLLPAVGYFYYHNALGELWYGTIGYNMEYANEPESPIGWHGYVFGIAHSVTMLLWTLSAIAVLLVLLKRKYWVISLLAVISSLALMKWFTSGNNYGVYALLAMPAVPWIVWFVVLIWKETQSKARFNKMLPRLAVGLLLLFTAFYPMRTLVDDIKMIVAPEKVNIFVEDNLVMAHTRQLMAQVPAKDRANTMAYNCLVAFYLDENIRPCLPYFIHQDLQTKRGGSLGKRIHDSFASGKAKYIIVQKEHTLIDPILQSQYTLVAQNTVPLASENVLLRLYRHKDATTTP